VLQNPSPFKDTHKNSQDNQKSSIKMTATFSLFNINRSVADNLEVQLTKAPAAHGTAAVGSHPVATT
jgi:hypothetical protein